MAKIQGSYVTSPLIMPQKKIEIVAGPNGSGKSTFAESFLIQRQRVQHFINPDVIAAGISPINVEKSAFQAGRIMISDIQASLLRGESFAFESMLSGKTWLNFLKKARKAGYEITIYFLFLRNVQENIRRVKLRVQQGGHFIAEEVIRRRYPKTFFNFWFEYRHLATDWYIFDNTGKKPRLFQFQTAFDQLNRESQLDFGRRFLSKKHS